MHLKLDTGPTSGVGGATLEDQAGLWGQPVGFQPPKCSYLCARVGVHPLPKCCQPQQEPPGDQSSGVIMFHLP